jgi:hypothetical protein
MRFEEGLHRLWNRFWFELQSPAPVCLFRILYGLLVLATALIWLPELSTYFGTQGWISLEASKHIAPGPRFSLFFVLPPSDQTVAVMFAVLLVSALFVTMGFLTRWSTIVLFLCLESFHFRDFLVLNGGDAILRIMGCLLIFAPCGKMFSVDARKLSLTDQWKIVDYCWVQRLMQLEICAVYFQNFCSKLQGETWCNGTALYYVSKLEDYAKFSSYGLFDQLWVCQLLTWATMAIEFSLFTLIWVPRFRYYVLAAGLLLHAGIEWCMNVQFFEVIMMATYINFVRPADVKIAFERIGALLRRSK